MPHYTQADRPLRITTPLGKDVLLITGFKGGEALSQLFSFDVDLLAENKTTIAFDKLLGKGVTVELALPGQEKRNFHGIVSRFSQRERDPTFTAYRARIVPQFWLLSRKARSRIFQHLSVPDILRKVLEGLDVKFEIKGTFHARDYCVQYRETDFDFASRLMEEEGIFYFFKHSESSDQLVVANTPPSHPDLPVKSTVIYEAIGGGNRPEDRIFEWEKVQKLRSGRTVLWDHSFELPHKHLEADKDIVDALEVGKVTHHLKVGGNEKLELYDFPGGYASRFDGIASGGGEQASEVSKIFQDNSRTVEIRMQEEARRSLQIRGVSNCREFVTGHKFKLERHFNGDGEYVLTSVSHDARLDAYRSGVEEMSYENEFTCIPGALPFRPPRVTPRPTVLGSQTAVVVGPPGEEIFTDKYGRVKVQFHWDREGKHNASSSCWIRVATSWAGKNWGSIHLPRIGQEVVVDFLEGDPNNPLIVGSVFNADLMPPYKLPDEKTKSTLQSRSSKGGGPANFNEIRFEDKKGSEQIFINAERDLDHRVENDSREFVNHDRHLIVEASQMELVKADKHGHVKGKCVEKIGGDLSLKVGGERKEKIGTVDTVEAGTEIHLKAGMKVIIEAGTQLTLKVGGNFVDISPAGVTIVGTMVKINSGGAAGSGTDASPEDPKAPDVADDGSKTGKLA